MYSQLWPLYLKGEGGGAKVSAMAHVPSSILLGGIRDGVYQFSGNDVEN